MTNRSQVSIVKFTIWLWLKINVFNRLHCRLRNTSNQLKSNLQPTQLWFLFLRRPENQFQIDQNPPNRVVSPADPPIIWTIPRIFHHFQHYWYWKLYLDRNNNSVYVWRVSSKIFQSNVDTKFCMNLVLRWYIERHHFHRKYHTLAGNNSNFVLHIQQRVRAGIQLRESIKVTENCTIGCVTKCKFLRRLLAWFKHGQQKQLSHLKGRLILITTLLCLSLIVISNGLKRSQHCR